MQLCTLGGKAPLKRLLQRTQDGYSLLRKLIVESQHGITLDFESVLSDLVEIWSEGCGALLIANAPVG